MAAQPYVGEIRIFAGNYAPLGWLFCDGQVVSIADYDTLFNLIGTTYGGDGQTTFALPDLRGRVPLHLGGLFTIGETGGAEAVTLTVNQIAAHNHGIKHWALGSPSAVAATSQDPAGNYPGISAEPRYSASANVTGTQSHTASKTTGGSQPHSNMPPYLGLDYIISLYGIFPTQ